MTREAPVKEEEWPTCPTCGRRGTQSDDHIFEGANFIEWWCETCGKVLKRIEVDPSEYEYIPVIWPLL